MDHYKIIRVNSSKIGEYRNSNRVYIQGKYLNKAGFVSASNININFSNGQIIIEKTTALTKNRVSSKKNGQIPVIDVVSKKFKEALNGVLDIKITISVNRIVISPSKTAKKIIDRSAINDKTSCSIFAGAGLMSYAGKNRGFKEVFAVETNDKYTEIYSDNFPNSTVYNMSVHDLDFDSLPQTELMLAGIPCEPYSRARRSGGYSKSLPLEAHELSDMTFWLLRIIDSVNPKNIVVEQSDCFIRTGAYYLLVNSLKRMGYHIFSEVMDSADYNCLQSRKRTVIVATTTGIYDPPEKLLNFNILSDILEDPEDCEWFDETSKKWLFEHWERQTLKGNNFAKNLILNSDMTKVQAIKKRYFAGQGDNPVVAHPTDNSLYRWFTLDEVKKLFTLDDDFKLLQSKTTNGEALGQGVVSQLFDNIIGNIT